MKRCKICGTRYRKVCPNSPHSSFDKLEPEISFKEHQMIGKALKIINEKITSNINSKYSNKVELRKSHEYKSHSLSNKLRNHMEEVMFKQHHSKANTNVYYGEIK